MQIKTTMRYHLTQVRIAIIKKSTSKKYQSGYGEKEPSYTVYRNVFWCSHYGKQLWSFLKKLKMELLYDPAITPGIHPNETVIQKDTCTPLFIAALFTIVKIWKQSNACQQMNG